MLRLILGRSGSGKTYTIRNMLVEYAKKDLNKLMLIVPEQNSFESERSMLELLGEKDFRKVEIVSFTRLVDFVLREIGGIAGKRLDDGGRHILMSLAMEQVKDELTLYNNQSGSTEMINLMITALKEFKMCTVTSDSLFKTAEDVEDNNLKSKIREAGLIMSAYEALAAQTYLDPLDDLTRLYNALKESTFFEGYTVMIDEFSGFTVQELNILEIIIKQAEECYISLCMEPLCQNDGVSLFSPIVKTANKLSDLAKKNGVKVLTPILLNEQHRFKSKGLKAVEQGIFRTEYLQINDEIENVLLYSATNAYDETDYIARTIKRLILEEDYRYRDFAVICRNIESYRGIIDTTFEKYDIPYFMDKPQVIDSKPLMNLLLTAFDVIHSNYNADNIFKYMKTGLAGFNVEEISILENYALMWDISGKKWLNDFKLNPAGFSQDFTQSDKEHLIKINSIRERVIDPILKFEGDVLNANGEQIARACYDLLENIKASNNLKKFIDELTLSGEFALVEEQGRLWDLLMQILDQTARVLKDKPIKSLRYAELLRLVINSSEMAFIPKGLDEVAIGSADRMRPAEPKVVFVIGTIEGEFPRVPIAAGIFSDYERRKLIAMGLPMYEDLVKLSIEERFIAYMAMTCSSQKLYVTWPCSNVTGSANIPSSIVRGIRKILPRVKTEDEYSYFDLNIIWAEKPAFELCAKQWGSDSVFSTTLKKYFSSQDSYKSKIIALKRAVNSHPAVFSNPEKAKKLFGGNMRVSASQVEKYYLCRFQYFCRYGLRAKERKKASFDALEYGSVMHFILENILLKYNSKDIINLKKEELNEEVSKLLKTYVETKLGGWDDKTARFKYLFFRLSNTAEFLIRHLAREFSQSEFIPTDYELNIAKGGDIEPLEIKLPDGDLVRVEGKVDRVDVMKKAGVNYVRIVDYKTGIKEFRLSDVIYGLNMQMLIYMAAIWSNGSKRYNNIMPAGVLYMPANRPLLNVEKGIEKDRSDVEINKKLRMNGLILDDPEVIFGMEADAKGVYIPVKLKDGKPDKLDSIADLAQMGSIVKHIEKLILSMASTLRSGDVSAEPVIGEYESCSWCPYSSVCGYQDGGKSIEVKKWDKESAMIEISRQEN